MYLSVNHALYKHTISGPEGGKGEGVGPLPDSEELFLWEGGWSEGLPTGSSGSSAEGGSGMALVSMIQEASNRFEALGRASGERDKSL